LDLQLSRNHDRNHPGHLPDWHAHLEEMLQQIKPPGGNTPGSISTSNAATKSSSVTSRDTGDQQPGHEIKCINPYSHQHLMKKLPEEWKNERINDEFKLRRKERKHL